MISVCGIYLTVHQTSLSELPFHEKSPLACMLTYVAEQIQVRARSRRQGSRTSSLFIDTTICSTAWSPGRLLAVDTLQPSSWRSCTDITSFSSLRLIRLSTTHQARTQGYGRKNARETLETASHEVSKPTIVRVFQAPFLTFSRCAAGLP